MKKLLFICPHLSTGGSPQFTLNRIELLQNDYDIYCVEWDFLSPDYVVQRKKIIEILGDKFFSVWDNKNKIMEIISQINPDIISIEEISETFIQPDILKSIYDINRKYVITETTHSSIDHSNDKKYLPDKFIFVSNWSRESYSHLGVDIEVIEYPVDKKIRDRQSALNKLGLDPQYKHVINVGLFTPGKNQGYLFKIAKELEDKKIKFHFIGNLAPNFQNYWNAIVSDKPDNCILWGEINNVDDFLQAADCFVLTSKFELNPLVVKEALCYTDLPIFMFNLDTYLGQYNNYKQIKFLSGNLRGDSNLVLKSLYDFNLKSVHLLVDTDSEREKKSIESMSGISKRIPYIQHINERYVGDEWRNQTPIDGWKNHGPGHWGCYQSFKKAILQEFTEDLDGLLIFEADCVLDVDMDEFIQYVKLALNYCLKHQLSFFTFGGAYVQGVLQSPEIESDDEYPEFYITDNSILAHCVLITKWARDYIKNALLTEPWDAADIWFNSVFKMNQDFSKIGISRFPLAYQTSGVSMIDNILTESKSTNDISDSVFVVLSHADTTYRKKLLLECLSKISGQIILSTNYPVSEEIQNICDWVIYSRENPLLYKEEYQKWGINHTWYVEESGKRVTYPFDWDHSYAAYTLIQNAINLCKKLGKNKIHIVNYDYQLNTPIIYLHNTLLDDQDLVFYRYSNRGETFSTGFFSGKLEALEDYFLKIKSKEEYYSQLPFRLLESRVFENYNNSKWKIKEIDFRVLESRIKTDQEGVLVFSKS